MSAETPPANRRSQRFSNPLRILSSLNIFIRDPLLPAVLSCVAPGRHGDDQAWDNDSLMCSAVKDVNHRFSLARWTAYPEAWLLRIHHVLLVTACALRQATGDSCYLIHVDFNVGSLNYSSYSTQNKTTESTSPSS